MENWIGPAIICWVAVCAGRTDFPTNFALPHCVRQRFFVPAYKKPHRLEQKTVGCEDNDRAAKKGAEQNAETEAQPGIGKNRSRRGKCRKRFQVGYG